MRIATTNWEYRKDSVKIVQSHHCLPVAFNYMEV